MGGGYVAKERKEIESVTKSGTEFEITWTLFFLMSFSVKAEKKVNQRQKRKEDDLQLEKNRGTVLLELTT